MKLLAGILLLTGALLAQKTQPLPNGYALPNGWRITPVGKAIPTEDMLLRLLPSPDGKVVVASHGGFNQHGLVVVDIATEQAKQRIPLKSAFLGLSWNPAGDKLYVSGGNANGRRATLAPIYVFGYQNGELTKQPVQELNESLKPDQVYWSGVAHHPKKDILYALNRGTGPVTGHVVLFDTKAGKMIKRIPVEVNPYQIVISADGSRLYVSNWASDSVSVIDTDSEKVIRTIPAGDNPNDLALSSDGRLFVSCGNENMVTVIDTKTMLPRERISVALHPHAPAGATPNGLVLDDQNKVLFVANGDNNSIAVINVEEAGENQVLGFIPAGWYPSSLALTRNPLKLFIGNSKGLGSYSNIRGPHSPLPPGDEGKGSVKSLQKGSINVLALSDLKSRIKDWTRQVNDNTPYRNEFLTQAKAPTAPSVVPREVGAGSPIQHVIYIIKENRTYDQVFGDLPQGNGDPRITIFGRNVTPNHHALAEQFTLLDNLFCDGEVSVDGHSWSNSAIATDFNEKFWPPNYGGHRKANPSLATVPSGGHMWDLAARKGLTYRSYGEYASRASDGTTMEASPGVGGLLGHVAPKFKLPGMRDTDNVREFLRELDEYEKNYDDSDPNKRLPNFSVMSLPEDHTRGTAPGAFTPRAMVANNDYAIGMLVERITKSRYWPNTAIFLIEDDAQDGSDHVDARRTVGLVISPYTKRKFVDSTLYTTSSMLRTMQLLLGLPPMTQYDAAATPMYNTLSDRADLTGFTHLKPQIDVNEVNKVTAWGAKRSLEMDFEEVDRAPMFALNEIIWKSVKGPDSPMPLPVHRFWFKP